MCYQVIVLTRAATVWSSNLTIRPMVIRDTVQLLISVAIRMQALVPTDIRRLCRVVTRLERHRAMQCRHLSTYHSTIKVVQKTGESMGGKTVGVFIVYVCHFSVLDNAIMIIIVLRILRYD